MINFGKFSSDMTHISYRGFELMLTGILIVQSFSSKIYRETPITLSGLILVPIMFHEFCTFWPFSQNIDYVRYHKISFREI